MTEEKLKILIREYPISTHTALAKKFGIDRSTLLYYINKLRDKGVIMKKLPQVLHPESQKLINKVIDDMVREEPGSIRVKEKHFQYKQFLLQGKINERRESDFRFRD